MSVEVADRVEEVRGRIADAARRSGRDPAEITLVGVSKRQPLERIAAAVRAGVTHLGENYVQEARDKQEALRRLLESGGPDLPQPPAPIWHFVGRLQRNKARDAVRLFACIESVDRASLAREIDRRAAAAERVLPVYLQVNLSGEPQKGGVDPDALPSLLAECAGFEALRVVGLMTVPAASPEPEASRPAFARLRELRDALRGRPGGAKLDELSMGMSADFEVAIEEGATLVRVGTALFGAREGTAPGR